MDLTLFEHFPEPVFYLEAGELRYSNPAALALEPQWTAGSKVPAALSLEPDEEGVFSCVLGGQEFTAAATRTGNGLLLALRRPVKVACPPLLSDLAGHLREHLNNIQAAARLLAPTAEESGEESARMHLGILYKSFYRLLRIVRHLDLAERAEQAEGQKPAEQAVDLAELCREVAYGAGKLAEQAGVNFQGDVPGGAIPTLGDPELLKILLLELISNALKAAGKGGRAGLKLGSNGRRALITVWDDGPGMSQAELAAMTDGSSPESLPKPGTGLRLGLPIARYAAEAHGGAILLESREGQGLRATASLPLRRSGKGELNTPSALDQEGGFSLLLTMLSDALPWEAFED